jgi:predicted ATPase
VFANLGNKSIEELAYLPECNDDPHYIAAMNVMIILTDSAYIGGMKSFLALIGAKMVNISLQKGNCMASGPGYVIFGTLYGDLTGDEEKGLQFCHLGLKLTEKNKDSLMLAKTYMVYSITNHLDCLKDKRNYYFERTYHLGIEVGSLKTACTGLHYLLVDTYLHGMPLHDFLKLENQYDDFLKNFANMYFVLLLCMKPAYELTNSNPVGINYEQIFEHSKVVPYGVACYYYGKLLTEFFLKEPSELEELADLTYEKALIGMFISYKIPEVATLASCIYIEAAVKLKDKSSRKYSNLLLKAKTLQKKHLENKFPPNYRHKYLLVEAEIASLESMDHMKIMSLYDLAIEVAVSDGFIQYAAIASELYAKYFSRIGMMNSSKVYMKVSLISQN